MLFLGKGLSDLRSHPNSTNPEIISSTMLYELDHPSIFADPNCMCLYADVFACNEPDEQTKVHELFYDKIRRCIRSFMKAFISTSIRGISQPQDVSVPWISNPFQTPILRLD
jgi:hypothetical protein